MWMEHFLYHIGVVCYMYIVEEGLVAGRNHQSRRKANCFLTSVDPMNVPMLTPLFERKRTTKIPSKVNWRSGQNTAHLFDLRNAQEKG